MKSWAVKEAAFLNEQARMDRKLVLLDPRDRVDEAWALLRRGIVSFDDFQHHLTDSRCGRSPIRSRAWLKGLPEVLSLLPDDADSALVASDDDLRTVGAAWWYMPEPPLLRDANGHALSELVVAVLAPARGRASVPAGSMRWHRKQPSATAH
jgi:hypothetical protein